MPDSHIHRNISPEDRVIRDAKIVADYTGGMRSREVRIKYQMSWETITTILSAAGVKGRVGGKRHWINKRVRKDDDTELVCSKCGTNKPICEFPKKGLICSSCDHKRLCNWRDENRAEVNRYIREWTRAKKKKDPQYRAICALKCRLVRVLAASGKKKSKASVTKFIGTSRNEFIAHIESLMLPGMTWENRSVGVWHIDHMIPCSAFDHTNPRQVAECWHYTNLRPLWGPENLRKYNKITIDCLIGPKMLPIVTGE